MSLFDVVREHSIAFTVLTMIVGGLMAVKFIVSGNECTSKARLDNKTVLITGGNTGIGKETAIDLAKRGARVLLACRDRQRAETAAEEIKKSSGSSNVAVYTLDLASLKSVRECADKVNKAESRLDILINNAGVMFCPYMKTEDGFEMQFGTNHLGHFLLTNLLLDKIKQSAPSRIITVSSGAHKPGSINFEDINVDEENYSRFTAYSQSKLANVLFTRELNKRLEGTGVSVYSLNPGVVNTELSRHLESLSFLPLRYLFLLIHHGIGKHVMRTPQQGAQTTICCAVDPDVVKQSGKYFSDCAVDEEAEQAKDDDVAARLWTLSEQMVGLKKE